jgi:hypothetical protein
MIKVEMCGGCRYFKTTKEDAHWGGGLCMDLEIDNKPSRIKDPYKILKNCPLPDAPKEAND